MSFKTFFYFFLPFFGVFGIHYITANLYADLCCPLSVSGILQSMMMTGSPACGVMLSVLNYTNNAYTATTAGMATLLIAKMTNYFTVSKDQDDNANA